MFKVSNKDLMDCIDFKINNTDATKHHTQKRIYGTLMQIWKSAIVYVFIWNQYVEDFTS